MGVDRTTSVQRTRSRRRSTTRELTFVEGAAYSVGHVLNDLCAACWFTLLLIFLTKVVGLPPGPAGAVAFTGQICDAIATPLVGLFSDRSSGIACLRLGPRKSWHAGGTVVVAICYFLVFGVCFPCLSGVSAAVALAATTAYYAVAAGIFNFGWAAVQVSHMALVPELSKRDTVRIALNSARYGFTVLSNVAVFVITWLLLHFHVGGEGGASAEGDVGTSTTYRVLAITVLCIGGATTVFFWTWTPEPTIAKRAAVPKHKPSEQPRLPPSAASVMSTMRHLRADDSDSIDTDSITIPESPTPRASPMGTINRDEEAAVPALLDRTSEDGAAAAAATSPSAALAQPHKPRFKIVGLGSGADGEDDDEEEDDEGLMEWKDWFRVPLFYTVGLNYMGTRLAVNISQVYMPFYVTDTLQMSPTAIAIAPLVVYVAGFLTTLLLKRVNAALGRRLAYFIGAVLVAGGCLAMQFIPTCHSWIAFPAAAVLGIGNSIIMVTSISLEADCVGENTESGAFVYGAFSLTDKLSNGVAILAIQLLQHGYSSALAAGPFFRAVMVWVPIASVIVGGVAAWTSVYFVRHDAPGAKGVSPAGVRPSSAASADEGDSLAQPFLRAEDHGRERSDSGAMVV